MLYLFFINLLILYCILKKKGVCINVLKRTTNLKIKILLILLFAFLFILILSIVPVKTKSLPNNETTSETSESQRDTAENIEIESILLNTAVVYDNLNYRIFYDVTLTENYLVHIKTAINTLECLDYSIYTEEATNTMFTELTRLKQVEQQLESDVDTYKTWEEQYFYATKVWEFLRQQGYNQEVTCAIIGNMMIETSGGSLALKPFVYSPSGNYYGLCQWSMKYYPEARDMSFEDQLTYLTEGIYWEINTFGGNYKKGFKCDDFLAMTDVEEAALAFAMTYERCGSGSYQLRQQAAVKAYNYFVLNND